MSETKFMNEKDYKKIKMYGMETVEEKVKVGRKPKPKIVKEVVPKPLGHSYNPLKEMPKNVKQTKTNKIDYEGNKVPGKNRMTYGVSIKDIAYAPLPDINEPIVPLAKKSVKEWNALGVINKSYNEITKSNIDAITSLMPKSNDADIEDNIEDNIELDTVKSISQSNMENYNKYLSKSLVTEEDMRILQPLILKWGSGYSPELYPLFEDKYQRLSLSFQLPTESHKEFLVKACVCSVKADNSMAHDNVKEAKEWMNMFKDITLAGKLQPSQISKSDLQHGMDTFGQLVKMVEEAVDIIPILPHFIEKPQDSVDFTILCFVNYIRKLQGLVPVEQKDIYEFYEVKRKELEIHQKNTEHKSQVDN